VLSFANVVNLFAHEFTGLRRWRLALTLVSARSFQCFFLRHEHVSKRGFRSNRSAKIVDWTTPWASNSIRMKTVLVLRHAKSSWDDSALGDHERPLNKRGRRDGPLMGDLVREQRLTPDVIISSDAVRARMTADAVAEAAGYTGEVLRDRLLYLAGPDDILAVLRSVAEANTGTVMIVGHNPGLEEFVAQLTGEHEALPTAALAQIVLPIKRWRDLDASTRGTLVGLWRPKELDDPRR
jgi:phosphohistidine phosphatase